MRQQQLTEKTETTHEQIGDVENFIKMIFLAAQTMAALILDKWQIVETKVIKVILVLNQQDRPRHEEIIS